jgi:hypothetical protein
MKTMSMKTLSTKTVSMKTVSMKTMSTPRPHHPCSPVQKRAGTGRAQRLRRTFRP